MARSQALEVQEKKELLSKDEKTVPARYYVPELHPVSTGHRP